MKLSRQIIFDDIKRIYECTDLKDFRNKKIFLAGANGLIGRYFAYLFYYLNEDHSFNIKVDLVTKDKISTLIEDFKNIKNFSIIQKDLSKYTIYRKKYDYIIYAAGYAAPAIFLRDPIGTMDVNYIGMKSILENYVKANPNVKILYFSSSEIYGSPRPGNFPTPETYSGDISITNSRACYIESKRLTEVLCLNYINLYNMYIKIVRPALLHGPGLTFDDQRVLSQFLRKAYYNKVIDMIDDGSDLRCFCYLTDALRQILNILLFGKETIYNVGSSEEEISIKELAIMIGEIMSAKVIPGPQKTPEVAGAPSRVCLDLTRVEKEFGFKPLVSLREGLKRTIDWNLALIAENNE